MNIRLVCSASDKKSKGAYIVYKGGKVEAKEVFSIQPKDNATLKEYTFESLIKGLRVVRSMVSHDDLLLVELPNVHMVEWLNGSKEYKGYSSYLDEILSIIDTIDCKYLFTKTKVKGAVALLDESVTKVEVTGIDDAFADLE